MNPNKFIDNIDNTIDRHLPQTAEAEKRRKNRILKPIAVVAVAAALFGGYKSIEKGNELPTFSKATVSYVVQPGEGMSDAAMKIEGVGKINIQDADTYIEQMPENAKVLEDGLQAHEQLEVPEKVETP